MFATQVDLFVHTKDEEVHHEDFQMSDSDLEDLKEDVIDAVEKVVKASRKGSRPFVTMFFLTLSFNFKRIFYNFKFF